MSQTITKTKVKTGTVVALAIAIIGTGGIMAATVMTGGTPYTNNNTADINRDGKIDMADLEIVKANWNTSCEDAYGCCKGDVNKDFDCNLNDDGKIDIVDVQTVASKIAVTTPYPNSNTADINRDGKTDMDDVEIVKDSWNTNCSSTYGCCKGERNKNFDCNLNDDGKIDIVDVQTVASKIATPYPNNNTADINRDGRTDSRDLEIVKASWNTDCGSVYGCCKGERNRNFDCNLNDDGKIDIIDVQTVASKMTATNR
ncbi:MAG TPA: dockerin type I domain-containing protein [Candidatus Moranbacteria bacterium]|nr:dockerin type I domain-containing protein [Candidatus Moranbacteria bacterium]